MQEGMCQSTKPRLFFDKLLTFDVFDVEVLELALDLAKEIEEIVA